MKGAKIEIDNEEEGRKRNAKSAIDEANARRSVTDLVKGLPDRSFLLKDRAKIITRI